MSLPVSYQGGAVVPAASTRSLVDEEEDANEIYLEIQIPCPLVCELEAHPRIAGDFWNDLTHRLRGQWARKIQQGQMHWVPLQPATIQKKIRQGVAAPERPMVGPHNSVQALMLQSQQSVEVTNTLQGQMVAVSWGPGPGEEQHPSERWQDLFFGAPSADEAMRFGRRGIMPKRPLQIDAAMRQVIQEELQRFLGGVADEAGVPRYCLEESLTVSPAHSSLQTGPTGPHYLLTEPP
jgi:hypothetical protein